MSLPKLVEFNQNDDRKPDSVLFLSERVSSPKKAEVVINPKDTTTLYKQIRQYLDFDETFRCKGGNIFLPEDLLGISVRKLIYSPLGPMNRDTDDNRRITDSIVHGLNIALKAGSKKPAVVLPPQLATGDNLLVALLAVHLALYVPLEVREMVEKSYPKVTDVSIVDEDLKPLNLDVLNTVNAIELGRVVARDVGGSDHIRMRPSKVEEYLREVFDGSCVKMEVIDDQEKIKKEFPLFSRVDAGSNDFFRGRIVFLTYEPEDGKATKDLFFIGKGVTFDTGGHDLKVNGIMKGMCRDKCGAANVAGLMTTVSKLKPRGVRVTAALPLVRNSISASAYACDELLLSRAGKRVRIVNTDAEGRMIMTDLLCYFKEKIVEKNLKDATIFTVSTLTGHARLAFGLYTAVMENGPAKRENIAPRLQELGEAVGDMFEISSIRREDYELVTSGCGVYEEVSQSNTKSSGATVRGHQLPAAFMILASGLDKHGLDSDKPIKYVHLDIARSPPHFIVGSTIPAFSRFILSQS